MRKVFCFFTVIALLMCCCSCSETDSVVFNGTNVLSVNGGYIAQIDNHYYIYTDIDGSPFDFIIDPMATDKSEAEVLCSDGSKVYYVNESSEIICRDMMTYEETVFFRPSDNGGLSLLGLADVVANAVDDASGYNISAMYIDSAGDAYVVCRNQLCRLKNGKIIPVLDNYIYSIRYDGNYVYFVDIARNFFVCDSDGSNLHKVLDTRVSSCFCISNNKIWYQPLNDVKNIYSCALDGSNKKIAVSDNNGICAFKTDEKYIYYTDDKNQYLYKSSLNSFKPELLLNQAVIDFTPVYGTDKLILSVSTGNTVKTIMY